jgi:demethylmenaquinone methyltransferase/2-methoxy-6-polyprenyl-1,4-benzoquinol methylase
MPSYTKNEPHTIQAMFDTIAKQYDLTNAILSLGLHHYWNRKLVQSTSLPSPYTLVDLCCGTGEIAFRHLRNATSCTAYLIDFSVGMLEYAKKKAQAPSFSQHQLHFIEADVQSLPLSNELADCATLAYGIRNVKAPFICLQEAFRILKPGGRLGILELTRPNRSFLRWGHRLYLKMCLPLLGKWLTANLEAYQYLRNSIDNFIPPDEIEKLLQTSGFTLLDCQPLLGGVATVFISQKPF